MDKNYQVTSFHAIFQRLGGHVGAFVCAAPPPRTLVLVPHCYSGQGSINGLTLPHSYAPAVLAAPRPQSGTADLHGTSQSSLRQERAEETEELNRDWDRMCVEYFIPT